MLRNCPEITSRFEGSESLNGEPAGDSDSQNAVACRLVVKQRNYFRTIPKRIVDVDGKHHPTDEGNAYDEATGPRLSKVMTRCEFSVRERRKIQLRFVFLTELDLSFGLSGVESQARW